MIHVNFKKIKAPKVFDLFAIIICFGFTIGAVLININRFWQYESGYYDFGIFDQAIWKIAHFKLPIIDHFLVPGKISLADHFHPTLYLFAPIYWFTNRSEALFILQDILVGLSGFVLYSIGFKKLRSRFISLCIILTYFLFAGLQNAVHFDFHELTVMTFFLALAYRTIITGQKKLFILLFILILGLKETLFLLGISISVFIFFYRKEWRKIAVFLFFLSIGWGIITIKFLIPYLSGGIYVYSPKAIEGLNNLFIRLTTPSIKLKTIFMTFLSFGFLPVLTPSLWLIYIFNFGSRFLMEGSVRWDLGLHYSAEIAPTLAFSSILALGYIKRLNARIAYGWAVGILLISIFLFRFVLHPPMLLAVHPVFYQHTKDFAFLDKLIIQIPKNASVVTQNNLASRFLHQTVWILRENYRRHKADYIILDLRPKQNPNNFLGIKNVQRLFKDILNNKDYMMIYRTDYQYIFKRIK